MFGIMNKATLQKNSSLLALSPSWGCLYSWHARGKLCAGCPSQSLCTQAQVTAFVSRFLYLLVFAPLLQFLHVHHATCGHLERIILQRAYSLEQQQLSQCDHLPVCWCTCTHMCTRVQARD